jgi:hypothetical protein
MDKQFNVRTDLHTNDGDWILCVNTTAPDSVEGSIETVESLQDVIKRYNIIVSKDQLNSLYNIKKHFAEVRSLIRGSGFYLLSERVAGECDAWINVLLTSLDPAHVRAPGVAEVVTAAAESFELLEYIRFNETVTYTLPQGEELEVIKRQLDYMPASVRDMLAPKITGDILTFTNCRAEFVWKT